MQSPLDCLRHNCGTLGERPDTVMSASTHPVHKLFRNVSLIMTGQTLSTLCYSLNLNDTHSDAAAAEAVAHLLAPLDPRAGEGGEEGKTLAELVRGRDGVRLWSTFLSDASAPSESSEGVGEVEEELGRDLARAYSRRCRVRAVFLNNNHELGSRGAAAFARALRRPGAWCRVLELADCNVGAEGAALLAGGLARDDSLRVSLAVWRSWRGAPADAVARAWTGCLSASFVGCLIALLPPAPPSSPP